MFGRYLLLARYFKYLFIPLPSFMSPNILFLQKISDPVESNSRGDLLSYWIHVHQLSPCPPLSRIPTFRARFLPFSPYLQTFRCYQACSFNFLNVFRSYRLEKFGKCIHIFLSMAADPKDLTISKYIHLITYKSSNFSIS